MLKKPKEEQTKETLEQILGPIGEARQTTEGAGTTGSAEEDDDIF